MCRWGGDEFVVVLRLGSADERTAVEVVVARLHQALAAPVEVNGALVVIGTTIGAATCDCGNCDLDHLFRLADRLLYDAKSHSRNTYHTGSCLAMSGAGNVTDMLR